MPWFRLYHEARTDAKLGSLADDEFRVWFNLLCYASDQDEERGAFDASDMFLIALECAGGDEDLLSRVVTRLSRLRIIESRDSRIRFINFEERQYDRPSDTPAQTRERKRKQRATTRDSDESPDVSRDVTRSHALEESRVEESRQEKKRGETGGVDTPTPTPAKRAHRIPESFAVTDGLREWGYKKSLTDAEMDRATERFVNYWQGSGKAKTDWPATWRGWMLREIEEGRMGANGGRTNGRTPHPQTDVVAAVFAEMRANGEIE